MTREGLRGFIHASEHSASLRQKIKKCTDTKSFVELAKNYGFSITQEDIRREEEFSQIEEWFKTSKISPFHPYSSKR